MTDPFLRFVRSGIRPGLGRIRRLLRAMDRPERSFAAVLVAGSNGKGSTAAYLSAIKRHPNDETALRSGLFHLAGRDWSQAIPMLKEAVKEAPNSAPAFYWLGFGEFTGKNFEGAAAAFKKAYALQPKNANYAYFLGYALESQGESVKSADLYREALRPQFHFSSKRGWINDTNGPVYYDGEYHLYYQHNPFGWDHSRNDCNKTWGHAVSTDLVHWTELPGVVHPDHLGPIYSGSAVVDEHNTTDFQTGKEKPIVAVYTSAGGRSPWSEGESFSQSIAYSNDRGRTFTAYKGNPVQPNIEYINRDPRAIWQRSGY